MPLELKILICGTIFSGLWFWYREHKAEQERRGHVYRVPVLPEALNSRLLKMFGFRRTCIFIVFLCSQRG